jgi:hypothetical protein
VRNRSIPVTLQAFKISGPNLMRKIPEVSVAARYDRISSFEPPQDVKLFNMISDGRQSCGKII